MLKLLFATLALIFFTSSQAAPESLKEAKADLERAKKLKEEGESKKAISILQKLADVDFPPAQYYLGTMYSRGEGIDKDEKKAFQWISSAAYYGFAEAQNSLGLMYDEGWGGVRKNDETAAHWYFQAANQGLTKAQVNIGMMFCLGEGARKDMVQCARWIKIAKDKGSKNAENAWISFELDEHYKESKDKAKKDSK